jgi:hypothetical protein
MYASSKVATVATMGLLVACATAPAPNANLDVARQNYVQSAGDPNTAGPATFKLKQASDALDQASPAWCNRDAADKVDALAYIAKQRVEIAREVAKRKAAERQLAEAGQERDRLLLAQRTAEADKARQSADMAQAACAACARLPTSCSSIRNVLS